MKKFSLIFNSRGRPQLLNNLLLSIEKTVNDLSQIECLIGFDDDDLPSINFIKEYSKNKDWLKYKIEPRDRHLIKRLNNLYRATSGEFIFVLNDDMEILGIQNWDVLSYNILKNTFSDQIIYARTTCDSVDKRGDYASFFIISRKACDVVGYFVNEDCISLSGDLVAYTLYKSIGRVIDVPIFITHILHKELKDVINPDLTCYEMRQLEQTNKKRVDLTQDILKLRNYINEVNSNL